MDAFLNLPLVYVLAIAVWLIIHVQVLRLRKKLQSATEKDAILNVSFDDQKTSILAHHLELWEAVSLMTLSVLLFPVLFILVFIPLAAFSMSDATIALLCGVFVASVCTLCGLGWGAVRIFSAFWKRATRLDSTTPYLTR